ncbi:hypothetical protein [Clostridium sp.]|uniref:hypothetical protein n=1 Tax=Clostridium sp. TaxID=1506 RepID=UPI0029139C7E|nr:hypothetical protein [Clostridium sp.]MDU5105714.1 hypothetical protein [Clostridium sp.]
MLTFLLFFGVLFIWFICIVIQHNMEKNKLKFASTFTILISIAINIFVVNIDTSFAFILKSISFLFLNFGIISGIQYLIRK